jgi:hypothetical protein
VEQPFPQGRGAWGSLGCAAAAARLYRLDARQTGHALGIADYHAPNAPAGAGYEPPSIVGQAAGWAALNGVMAAELAGRGFTGIPNLLELPTHYEAVQDLGQRYWLLDGSPRTEGSATQADPPGAGVSDTPIWTMCLYRQLKRLVSSYGQAGRIIAYTAELDRLEDLRQMTGLLAIFPENGALNAAGATRATSIPDEYTKR